MNHDESPASAHPYFSAMPTWRAVLPLLMALLLLTVLPWQPASAESPDAAATVNSFQDTLLGVMKDAKALGYQGRYDKLVPAVKQSHDLAGIAQFAAGRYWDKLSDAEKTSLVDTFSKLSIATYAYRFSGYSGETFSPGTAQSLAEGDMLVRTELTEGGGEVHHFDYTLHQVNGNWQIINLVADGVSDLAIKRSEYGSIIRTQGLDALLKKLQAQIDQYSKSA